MGIIINSGSFSVKYGSIGVIFTIKLDVNTMRRDGKVDDGINFKALRKQASISQADIVRELNVKSATVSRWETGERIPSDGYRYKLALLFTERLKKFNIVVTPMDVYNAAQKSKKERDERMAKLPPDSVRKPGRPRKKKGTEGAG